ncbi:MAG TPA: NAD(P) transhydrogenase subunit alpha [Actinomycetota bacterium]|jgi:NAD(P) transhydrogenase subunit alpha|nr:NAD(P) transhydrogenase subunit alpha [Actinomycetota bacterium]
MTATLEVSLFIFVLASFLGYTVITRVPGLLHTPLMSLTNALSAISIVGSLLLAGGGRSTMATVLGSVAVFASFTNIVSGFLLTDRMLGMFKRREAPRGRASTQEVGP